MCTLCQRGTNGPASLFGSCKNSGVSILTCGSQSLDLRMPCLSSCLCELSNHLMCPSAKVLQADTLEPFNGTIITMIKESCHCTNLP